MKKIFTVIGARPQFIKASVVSRAIRQAGCFEEILLHTGQHFDTNMSDVFFNELDIPKPDIRLDINGGSHGQMTGLMLQEIEQALLNYRPDCVLVYGDTNSTLAGALAASKLDIPIAHVEAGLRSYNRKMPEEVNRVLTDQLSSILFCPTATAVENLEKEGIRSDVYMIGDVMLDSSMLFSNFSHKPRRNIPTSFILATLHRAENTDNPERLSNLVSAINYIHENVMEIILPLHPRTKQCLSRYGLKLKCILLEPVSYFEMLWLLKSSHCVLTDSGGVQKEAYFFSRPCVTLRDETEWKELVDLGVNKLAGADRQTVVSFTEEQLGKTIMRSDSLYGDGRAADNVVEYLRNYFV